MRFLHIDIDGGAALDRMDGRRFLARAWRMIPAGGAVTAAVRELAATRAQATPEPAAVDVFDTAAGGGLVDELGRIGAVHYVTAE